MWANSPWRPADARRNISTTRTTQDSLTKLWTPCNVLKDDGVTSPQDVSELTDLLFLKMVQELGQEQGIAEPWRQSALQTLQGVKQLAHDMLMLLELGSSGSGASALLQEIVANASSFIKKPTTFNRLLSEIDTLDGYSAHQQGLGDLSEGLLQERRRQELRCWPAVHAPPAD